jgi:hypothetical protein
MALSNIFNEPRREITETLVGIVLVGFLVGFFIGDYYLAKWFETVKWSGPHLDGACPWPLGMIMFPLLPVALISTYILIKLVIRTILIVIPIKIHNLGERTCDILEILGIRLRPRKRYGNSL